MMSQNFFRRVNPETEEEGLDRAAEVLERRYRTKEITLEQYKAQAMEIQKKREQLRKRKAK